MLYFSAEIISKLYPVSRGYSGICCKIVNSSYSACCQNHRFCGIIMVLSRFEDIEIKILPVFFKTQKVRIFHYGEVFKLYNLIDKRSHYLKARAVLMMSNAVTGMAALKSEVYRAVLVAVKINAVFYQVFNVGGSLLHKNFKIVHIVLVSARNKGILNMQGIIVVLGVHYRGHPTLSQSRVTQRYLLFGNHKDFQRAVKVKGTVKTRHPRPHYNYVKFFKLHCKHLLLPLYRRKIILQGIFPERTE